MNTKMKSLFRYILPTLGGLFVTYLYNVVDGIFVGRGVGSAALGALSVLVLLRHFLHSHALWRQCNLDCSVSFMIYWT